MCDAQRYHAGPLVIKGPNGGDCKIYRKFTNCRQRPGGGCTCDYTVTAREATVVS